MTTPEDIRERQEGRKRGVWATFIDLKGEDATIERAFASDLERGEVDISDREHFFEIKFFYLRLERLEKEGYNIRIYRNSMNPIYVNKDDIHNEPLFRFWKKWTERDIKKLMTVDKFKKYMEEAEKLRYDAIMRKVDGRRLVCVRDEAGLPPIDPKSDYRIYLAVYMKRTAGESGSLKKRKKSKKKAKRKSLRRKSTKRKSLRRKSIKRRKTKRRKTKRY